MDKIALILAAGQGKRMKSDIPKVLHKINGKYMIDYVLEASKVAGIDNQIMVIGHKADMLKKELADRNIRFALQSEQLGTGHAVMMAQPMLDDFEGDLIVLCGDMPLVKSTTIEMLYKKRRESNAAAIVLSVEMDEPGTYGRIVRDSDGFLSAIVEYRDADEETRKIKEINTGAYCFNWKELSSILGHLNDNNDQKEYYLTDSISIFVKNGQKVGAIIADDPYEGLGINSTDQLKLVENIINSGTH